MISGYESYSYNRRRTRGPLFRLLRLLVVTGLVYFLITALIVFTLTVGSRSMEPALNQAERLVITPLVYGVPVRFGPKELRQYRSPRRGDIVAFRQSIAAESGWWRRALQAAVRLVTLNRRGAPPLQVKRVIGIPGDTIALDDMVAELRPPGQAGFQSETQVIPVDYSINTRIPAQGWDYTLPFSGDLDAITLGPDEFFLLGDNRSAASDSRAWGPVRRERIVGQAIFRYWPLNRIGRP